MKTLFRVITGSVAYGTNLPTSDRDEKFIYSQSFEDLLGFNYKEQIEVNKDNVGFEIKRFLELLESANPGLLEVLYSPEDVILEKDPLFDIVLENRDKFLTKKCRHSFGGFAVAQLKKSRGLQKKINWEVEKVTVRKNPIDFCNIVLDSVNQIEGIKQGVYPLLDWLRKKGIRQENVYVNKLNHTREGYQLYLGNLSNGITAEDSTRLRTPSSPADAVPIATVLYNPDGFTDHCKRFESYQTWLKERNEQRYLDNKGSNTKYDTKNILHLRRLLDMALEIPVEKTIHVRRKNADELLKIRKGEVDLDDVIKKAEEDLLKLDDLYKNSDLPDEVDKSLKSELILQIRGLK